MWGGVVWSFVSPAQLLGRLTCCDLYNQIRTLKIRMLDGKLKASLEGPKMSLLTKLVFVT